MNWDVAKRVAQGAAWLDREGPGWERLIDLASLDVALCTRCILGQLSDHLTEESDLSDSDMDDFGFFAYTETAHGFLAAKDEYRALDEAWTALIKERFNSGLLSEPFA